MDLEAAADADEFLVATVIPYASGREHKIRKMSKAQFESFLSDYHQFAERLLAVVPDTNETNTADQRGEIW